MIAGETTIRVSANVPLALQFNLVLVDLKPWLEDLEVNSKIKKTQRLYLHLKKHRLKNGTREVTYRCEVIEKIPGKNE